MNEFKVSVIIPAYNEATTIGDIVSKIKALYPDFEIIVVNDGSTDETPAVAKRAGAIVYSHPYNIGNGAAIKSGIRAASGESWCLWTPIFSITLKRSETMLNYFPEYDMVVGARSKKDQISLGRALGNIIYNWLASYVSKFNIQDLTSGFRAIKLNVAKQFLYLLPNSYSYPATLTLAVLRTGRALKYIPITVKVRKAGKSNIKIFQRRRSIFYDHRQNLYAFFSFQNISSGQLYYVLFGTVLLHVYFFDVKAFYEYECTFIHNLNYHIYDGADIGTDLSDEI